MRVSRRRAMKRSAPGMSVLLAHEHAVHVHQPRADRALGHRCSVGFAYAMRVLVPLPDRDFDTTEVAVPWRLLTERGHELDVRDRARRHRARVRSAPAHRGDLRPPGRRARADPLLRARCARRRSSARPIAWEQIDAGDYDGLLLAGGHAPRDAPVPRQRGAARGGRCVLARWTGRSARSATACSCWPARATPPRAAACCTTARTTCLPKYMERSAFLATAWRLGRYYRTYPEYVEDEVVHALRDPSQFERGPRSTKRGTREDDAPAFVVAGRQATSRPAGRATPTSSPSAWTRCCARASPPGARAFSAPEHRSARCHAQRSPTAATSGADAAGRGSAIIVAVQLNHVALTVGDRERSAAFYGEHFGLTERVHDDEHLLILRGARRRAARAERGAGARRPAARQPLRLRGRRGRAGAKRARAAARGRGAGDRVAGQPRLRARPGRRPRRLPRRAVRVPERRRAARALALDLVRRRPRRTAARAPRGGQPLPPRCAWSTTAARCSCT